MAILSDIDLSPALLTSIAIAKERNEFRADAMRYRKIRAARRFIGMLETVTMHAETEAEYDEAVDRLPAVKP